MVDNSTIWTGEASRYDRARPTPPSVLPDILTQLIHTPQPELVVDLGSGTGLSTMLWGEQAQHVVGIEPNEDMRTQAIHKLEQSPYKEKFEYRAAFAHETGLPANSAAIVTCSQSFHWMEPTATLAEIARILRPGGLFAAYDYTWPPAVHWELEQVYQQVDERFDALMQERERPHQQQRWSKETHLDRMRASGHFQFTRELFLHHREQGDATRFIDMIMTNAYGHQFKEQTVTEQEVGFDQLKQAAHQYIGSTPFPWYFSYMVRIGVK